jgi:predicted nucleic acid-binding protein
LPEVICNTSPLQYLHQVGQLRLLPALAQRVVVPPAVADGIATGRAQGLDLPDVSALGWIEVRGPASAPVLPLVTDLGPGETEVLALAIESGDAIVVLDDAVARRVAETLGLKLTGTLGLLLDGKRAGLITAVAPVLDQLQALRFRVAAHTRAAVLKLAGETR